MKYRGFDLDVELHQGDGDGNGGTARFVASYHDPLHSEPDSYRYLFGTQADLQDRCLQLARVQLDKIIDEEMRRIDQQVAEKRYLPLS